MKFRQGWGSVPQPNLYPLQSGTPQGSSLNKQSDIPLTIKDCWLPTAHLPAFLIAPIHFCLPALTTPLLA